MNSPRAKWTLQTYLWTTVSLNDAYKDWMKAMMNCARQSCSPEQLCGGPI